MASITSSPPDGLNVHGTASKSLGAIIELAPLLTDNRICLPDGFCLNYKMALPANCRISIWDDKYVLSHQAASYDTPIPATGGLTHVSLWIADAGAVDFDGLKISIVYGKSKSYDYPNGTGEVYDTGVEQAFTSADSPHRDRSGVRKRR